MASQAPAVVGLEQRGYARVIDDDDVEDDEKAAQRRRWKRLAVKCLKYLYSTAGMGLLTAGYVTAGMFAFQAIELPHEMTRCLSQEGSYFEAENASVAIILDHVRKFNGTPFKFDDDRVVAEGEMLDALRNFSSAALAIGYKYSNVCSTLGQPNGRSAGWSMLGSLFFSITVVTTVGYGDNPPTTTAGRVLCMFYALFGIPILLACLANLTGLMANVFRFVYASFCCCGCLVPDDAEEDRLEPPPLAGPSSKAVWVTDATGRPIERLVNAPPASRDARAASPSSQSDSSSDGGAAAADDYDDDDEEEEAVSVPLTVAIATLLTCIAIGGSIFSVLDEQWTYVNSFYFAFVTTATIGFGDIIPDYKGDITKILVNSVFMVIGIAMLGMCFQLMQDEMVTKMRWLVSKFKRRPGGKDGDASALDSSVKA